MEPRYEIYVRLPFNRGDFVDPPPVDWDDSKSDALWNIISEAERTERKIDWNELAISFGVGVDFLLMMAQTLAERHTNQLMGLFRKAAAVTAASGTASPITPGFASGVSAQDTVTSNSGSSRRTASGSGNRPASPASLRRGSPLPRPDSNRAGAGTPLKTSLTGIRPPLSSRSATPVTVAPQTLASGTSQHLSPGPSKRPKSPMLPRHRPSSLHLSTTGPASNPLSPEPAPSSPARSSASSSSSPSSSGSSSPVESRIIKRPPRSHPKSGPSTSAFSNNNDDDDDDEEEEEEAEPAFLPYNSPNPPTALAGSSDLGATLRGAAPLPSRRQQQQQQPQPAPGSKGAAFQSSQGEGPSEMRESQTSEDDSSNSSAAAAVAGRRGPAAAAAAAAGRGRGEGGVGPLSPRRTAELAGKGKARAARREGSDGTPSMGSSFSDLDDASVTQSALEEALASNMQDGGATVGSRMSTFGNAFKSRYLPKGKR